MIVNFGKDAQPLALDISGRAVTSCRITDGARTWEKCDLPANLPPYSFIVVTAGK